MTGKKTGHRTIKTNIDWYEPKIKCPYKDKCRSYPYKCDSCRNNKSKKDDYYEPEPCKIWYGDPTYYIPSVMWGCSCGDD